MWQGMSFLANRNEKTNSCMYISHDKDQPKVFIHIMIILHFSISREFFRLAHSFSSWTSIFPLWWNLCNSGMRIKLSIFLISWLISLSKNFLPKTIQLFIPKYWLLTRLLCFLLLHWYLYPNSELFVGTSWDPICGNYSLVYCIHCSFWFLV